MSLASPTQPAEPASMQLEESAVDSIAVDPAIAAAAATLAALPQPAAAAAAGQVHALDDVQLCPNGNRAHSVLLCPARGCG
jgi:hypothetical protein